MSFTAFPLDKLGLSPAHLQLCTKANFINAQDVLLPSIPDLSRRLKIRLTDAQSLVRAVSIAIAPRTSVVSDLVGIDAGPSGAAGEGISGLGKRKRPIRGGTHGEKDGWISTGDKGLDTLLGGGIRIGCITEIVGESAAGKSHLTLHLAIAAQLPSLTSRPGGAMILTSERELATTRLKQLAEDMRRRHAQNIFLKRDSLFDGVLTRRVENVEELEAVLSYGVPALLERGRGGSGGNGGRLMGFAEATAEAENDGGDGEGRGSEERRNGERGNSTSATPGSTNRSTPSLLAPLPRTNRQPRGSTSALPAPVTHRARAPPAPSPIRLIIIDSLTALLRGAETSFTSTSAGFTARSRHLCSIGDKLKALAVEYELAIVVINQVSDVFDRRSFVKPAGGNDEPTPTPHPTSSGSLNLTHDQAWYAAGPDPPMLYSTQSRWFSGQGSNGKKEATLGIVWANMVNTRIMLSRTGRRRLVRPDEMERSTNVSGVRVRAGAMRAEEGGEVGWAAGGPIPTEGDEEGERMLIRKAHLVFSPFATPGCVDYVIATNGVQALPDTYKLDEDGATVLARAKNRGLVQDGEEEEGPADGDGEDDLFGPMDGLDDVPDEWWAGIVDGEVQVEAGAAGGGT